MLYTYIYIYYIVASWCTLFEATQTLTIAFPTRGKAHIVWDARSPRLVRSRIFVDGTEKKKKKIRHVYARIRIYKFPKENLQWDLFFFLNFTSNDDQIRKTFLFLRSRSKGRNLASILTRSLFGSSKLVFDLFSFVVCACSRFDRLDRRRFIISSIDGGEKDGEKSTRGARTRVN